MQISKTQKAPRIAHEKESGAQEEEEEEEEDEDEESDEEEDFGGSGGGEKGGEKRTRSRAKGGGGGGGMGLAVSKMMSSNEDGLGEEEEKNLPDVVAAVIAGDAETGTQAKNSSLMRRDGQLPHPPNPLLTFSPHTTIVPHIPKNI